MYALLPRWMARRRSVRGPCCVHPPAYRRSRHRRRRCRRLEAPPLQRAPSQRGLFVSCVQAAVKRASTVNWKPTRASRVLTDKTRLLCSTQHASLPRLEGLFVVGCTPCSNEKPHAAENMSRVQETKHNLADGTANEKRPKECGTKKRRNQNSSENPQLHTSFGTTPRYKNNTTCTDIGRCVCFIVGTT